MTYWDRARGRERKLSGHPQLELDKESLAEQGDKDEATTEAAFKRLA
jgi:hypothetical protein